MKLPLYEGPKPFSRIEICQDSLRRAVTDEVNKLLEIHSSIREVETMCTVLDGVRDSLAAMALKAKRKERNEVKRLELKESYFENSSEVKFVPRSYVPIMTSKKFVELSKATKGNRQNGKR